MTTSEDSLRRADMVFFETPRGGAVFSVGSIAWNGSLSHNDFQNNVSRITENVLRRLMVGKPFAWPETAEEGAPTCVDHGF